MSRVSRRKTLSHSEIENFLSEIDVPSETDKKSLPSYGAQYCVPLDSLVSDSSIDNANETRKFNAQISDVEMIRAFTRVSVLFKWGSLLLTSLYDGFRRLSPATEKESQLNLIKLFAVLGENYYQ